MARMTGDQFFELLERLPMISSPDSRDTTRLGWRLGPVALIALVSAMAVLVGCTGKQTDASASQTAATVNKADITVQQINFVMQQQRGLKPEQADAAAKQILERLIDQEVALQKAQELQLDRDPRVVQQLEAARRDIVARAYIEKSGEAAAKPSPEDIKKYYDAHPALFSARRIYNLQELAIEAKPEQTAVLREQLATATSVNEFIDYLKANNIRFSGNQAVRTAEQLPMNMIDTIAKLNDGQAVLFPSAIGAQVVVLAGSRSEPVDEARAKPVIEQFLLNDAKRKVAEADMKALRAAAKVEYVGKFATGTASAPTSPEVGASAAFDSSPSANGLK
ncbi:MAG: EpsD family peptidyl-prolyl cis-trans isomerase [Pseudomonadota bacterium]|nr:EpsD family peptidyl-prolyl cis-trans isomerase [Pseudomonadota bacterium]